MSLPKATLERVALLLGCVALGAYVLWIYLPGIHGSFIFDDWANLPALAAQGPLDHAANFFRFLTSGKGDPTGRPVSMLAFAINAKDWPADPAAFKLVNVALHALNAALLACTLFRTCIALGLAPQKALQAAGIAAMSWAIHPLFASTVLYVVQREALLAGTFILAGMLCWLSARERMLHRARGGAALLIAGVAVSTTLACLSKANGILLPLMILGMEASLPPVPLAQGVRYRRLLFRVCGPVAGLVVAGLALLGLSSLGDGPLPQRGWSVAQRLLTEPVVLWDYLAQLLLLKPVVGSVFHDQYPVARNALDPWYVLPAMIAWALIAVAAWRYRRRYPVMTLAATTFLLGHVLESTSIGLEIYFEHRNYVPAMTLFLPLGVALAQMRRRALATGLFVVVAAGLGFLTRSEALRWSNPLEQAEYWAATQPASPRAQAYAAQVEMAYEYHDRAAERLLAASKRFPAEPQVAFNVVDASCATGSLTDTGREALLTSLRSTTKDPGPLLLQWFETKLDARNGECEGMSPAVIASALDTAAANPAIAGVPGRRQDVMHLRGELALRAGRPGEALSWFNDALAQWPTPQAALRQAAELGASGWPSLGVRHLDTFAGIKQLPPPRIQSGMPWVHFQVLRLQNYWPLEIENLRAALTKASDRAGDAAQ